MIYNQTVKYNSPERLSTIFAALGDPTRLAILERLSQNDATVSELAEPFTVSMPAISRHLKVLERAGLISRKHKAQWRQCHLERDTINEISTWADQYKQLWTGSFDRMEVYLDESQKNETNE